MVWMLLILIITKWISIAATNPWEFETLMQPTKNIFFVASIQRKGHLRVSFLRWLGHSSLRSSLCERSDAELGSHSPLGDRQARLSGGERANPRQRRVL